MRPVNYFCVQIIFVMKIKLFLFFSCMIFCLQLTSQNQIYGKVTDTEGNPLIGASVYLNNTSAGTTTDENGEFEFSIKSKEYTLVISYIGYETILFPLKNAENNKQLVFKMIQKINMLNEVVISKNKMSKEDRIYYMRQFKNFFLGRTNLAKECKILNEDTIQLDYDEETRTLTASAYEPIKVKHNGLGYLISYDLVLFSLGPKKVSYLGYSRYEDLKGSKRKKRNWKKKRTIAYKGSSMHFFRSLMSNSLSDERFVVDQYKKVPNPKRPHDSIIKKAQKALRSLLAKQGTKPVQFISSKNPQNIQIDLNSMKSSPIILGDTGDKKTDSLMNIIRKSRLKKFIDVTTRRNLTEQDISYKKDSIYHLRFDHFLKVKFLGEPEEDNYRIGKAKLNHQISYANLYVKSTPIGKNGTLLNPLDLLITGYWGYEKLADTVPLDYVME